MNTYIRRPLALFDVFFNSGPMALDHISVIKSIGLADHSKILGAFLAKELLQPENQSQPLGQMRSLCGYQDLFDFGE